MDSWSHLGPFLDLGPPTGRWDGRWVDPVARSSTRSLVELGRHWRSDGWTKASGEAAAKKVTEASGEDLPPTPSSRGVELVGFGEVEGGDRYELEQGSCSFSSFAAKHMIIIHLDRF